QGASGRPPHALGGRHEPREGGPARALRRRGPRGRRQGGQEARRVHRSVREGRATGARGQGAGRTGGGVRLRPGPADRGTGGRLDRRGLRRDGRERARGLRRRDGRGDGPRERTGGRGDRAAEGQGTARLTNASAVFPPPPPPWPFPFPGLGLGLGEGAGLGLGLGPTPTTRVTDEPSLTLVPATGLMLSTIPDFADCLTGWSTTVTNTWIAPSAPFAELSGDPTTSGSVTIGATPLLTESVTTCVGTSCVPAEGLWAMTVPAGTYEGTICTAVCRWAPRINRRASATGFPITLGTVVSPAAGNCFAGYPWSTFNMNAFQIGAATVAPKTSYPQ